MNKIKKNKTDSASSQKKDKEVKGAVSVKTLETYKEKLSGVVVKLSESDSTLLEIGEILAKAEEDQNLLKKTLLN